MVCGSVFTYMSKLQPTAVDDTRSTELVAARQCAKRLRWAQNLVTDLKIKHHDAVHYCDNKSTIQVLTQENKFISQSETFGSQTLSHHGLRPSQLLPSRVLSV
ncbi:TPA: hypothetical protein N0F65_012564 [Lagenidium giganteum]|uniref:Uncharacterized protein n=1 Tax=Lagenidium giganteum TaxID=4803 RepID=A0AAV2YS52_9STRA|nr:TPA: hypothetical protein N0F65_012564 [Lagenidium giganteum]